MTWIKIEDTLPDNPKLIEAGPEAGWLYVAGLCYSSRMLTDGTIPKAMVARLTDIKKPKVAADRLVSSGLWVVEDEHYVIHDYLEHQRSREQIEGERVKSRERQQRHREKSHRESHRESRRDEPVSNDVSHGTVTQPESDLESDLEKRSFGRSLEKDLNRADELATQLVAASQESKPHVRRMAKQVVEHGLSRLDPEEVARLVRWGCSQSPKTPLVIWEPLRRRVIEVGARELPEDWRSPVQGETRPLPPGHRAAASHDARKLS